jgi:hypothetical protein
MKYIGSKRGISKYILPIILNNRAIGQAYVEPFVGGCNMIDKVDGYRVGSDINKYLISMWKALQSGWIPPKEITRNMYSKFRDEYKSGNAHAKDYPMIFWDWAREKRAEGHTVFVSEYNAPNDFKCVWEKIGISSSLRSNNTVGGAKKSTEKLFKLL